MSRVIRRTAAAIGIVVAGLTAAIPSAAAADQVLKFPAGQACAFPLNIDIANVGSNTVRVDSDRHVISAGTGSILTFTNVDNGKTLTTNSNGSVQIRTPNADGTTTVTLLGHNVVILFPTDVPAGPSTTLYVGRVVYTEDAAGNFTILTHSGQTTDICAALS